MDEKPVFTSRQMLALSTVFAVATFWAITRLLRDSLQYATLDLGPLGSYACDEGWVPPAVALVVGLLPQVFVYVRAWMKTGKRPQISLQDVWNALDELKTEVKHGAGVVQSSMAMEQHPSIAPAPAPSPPAPAPAPVYATPAPVPVPEVAVPHNPTHV
jgi:hypothetical protein